MSFDDQISLNCFSCKASFSNLCNEIPPDLLHLLYLYKIPGIIWLCHLCREQRYTNNSKCAASCHEESELSLIMQRIQFLEKKVAYHDNLITRFKKNMQAENGDMSETRNFSVVSPTTSFNNMQKEETNCDSDTIKCLLDKSEVSSTTSTTSPPAQMNLNSSLSSLNIERRKTSGDSNHIRVCQDILNNVVRLDPDLKKKSLEIVDSILDQVRKFLKKEDDVFDILYYGEYKTGSFYNGLKIVEADEYDIDVVFCVKDPFSIQVEFLPDIVFAKLKWTVDQSSKLKLREESVLKMLKKNSTDGYIEPVKIRAWMHSLIVKFLNSNPVIPNVSKIATCQSGPARTLVLTTKDGSKISLDLVPVFKFDFSVLEGISLDNLEKYKPEESKRFCFFVPKECRSSKVISASDIKFTWRIYLPEVEKTVLKKKLDNAKNVIRLLKLFRDKAGLKPLASYHMYTIVYWMIDENPNEEYWSGPVLFKRFIEALRCLQSHCKARSLPYFLWRQCNLFEHLNAPQCDNYFYLLEKRIHEFESDSDKLRKFFLPQK